MRRRADSSERCVAEDLPLESSRKDISPYYLVLTAGRTARIGRGESFQSRARASGDRIRVTSSRGLALGAFLIKKYPQSCARGSTKTEITRRSSDDTPSERKEKKERTPGVLRLSRAGISLSTPGCNTCSFANCGTEIYPPSLPFPPSPRALFPRAFIETQAAKRKERNVRTLDRFLGRRRRVFVLENPEN